MRAEWGGGARQKTFHLWRELALHQHQAEPRMMKLITRPTRRALMLPIACIAALSLSSMSATLALSSTMPTSQGELECEPKTSHHEVFGEDGSLSGIFVVKTKRNCLTVTTWVPVGP